MLDKLQKEANNEIKKIQKETKSGLEEIEKETQKLVEEIKKKELDKEISRIEFLKKRTETEHQQEARKIIIQTREKLIDEVFEIVEQEVSLIRKNKKYEKYLEITLIKAVRNMREKQIKILIDKKDEAFFSKIVKTMSKKDGIDCIINTTSLKTQGGFILTDSRERVRINHTIENLLESSREKIRTRINDLIFT